MSETTKPVNGAAPPVCPQVNGATPTTTSTTATSNGVKEQAAVLNGFSNNNNNNSTVNNNNNNSNGGWTPPPFAPAFVPQHFLAANAFPGPRPKGIGPRGHSPKRPARCSPSPHSRGGSPNGPMVAPPPPPLPASLQPLGPGQHVVHLHVNPGETIQLQMGNDIQLIQGPATVRMVSNNSSPPIPMPVQVPPGHMVQQIVDENGTLRHVILSPQPPMAVPMGPTYAPGPAPSTGPTSAPYYTYHPAYPPQYHPHHPPPPPHLAHPLHGPSHPHQCNNHHQGPSPPPLHPLHKDERTQRQFHKLKRKLDARQRENHIVCHTSPPTSPKKENGTGTKKYKDRNTSTSGLDEGDEHHSQQEEEDVRILTELLSNIRAPQVSKVTKKSAFLQWKPPDMFSENGENKYSEYEVQESEFLYEVLLSDRAKDGKYRVVSSHSELEYTLTDLKPACEYFVCIQAILDDLRGNPSETVTVKTLSCEPDVPVTPKLVNRTKTSITLRWNAVADNGSKLLAYILEYDEGKGDNQFLEVFSGVQKQFKVTKLTASTCYRFRLSAANDIGKSGYGEVVCYSTSGSAPSQPSPPQLHEAFINKLHLVWQSRPNDDTYTIQMEEPTTGHGFLPVYNGAEASHICCGLKRNKEYKFRLCANNEEGSSRWSDVVACRTIPERPTAPSRPALKGKAHSKCFKASWDPPKDNGGTNVTSYVLEMDCGNGFVEAYEGAELEFNCDHLVPGSTYKLRVLCKGAGGKSDYSEIGSVATIPVCPGQCCPPRLLGKAKAISVHLKWAAPEYDGGAPITEYEVDITNPDDSSRIAYRGRDTDCVVAGLQPGKPYHFKVRAYNKAGFGSWSEPMEAMSGAGPPDSPQEPHVACKSPHSALVSWDEPPCNGAAVTEYRLEWSQKDSEFSQLFQGPGLSYEVKGLIPATQYSFKVQALNGAGIGAFSPCACCTTPSSSPAAISSSLIRCTCTPSSIALAWMAPDCHGSEILAYNIDMGERHNLITIDSSCEHCIEGLMPETTYRIRIQAVNSVGVGPFSSPVKVTTRALPPPPPRLECLTANHNSLKIKWGDGKNADFTHYTLEIETRNGIFVPVYQGTTLGYKVTKLSETTDYRFRIFASNDAGSGPLSEVYIFSTTKSPPSSTKAPLVAKLTETACFVEWQGVRPVGEDRLVYQLQLLNSRDQEFRSVYRGDDTSFEIQGLEPKTEYLVRVGTIRECRDGSGSLVGPFSPTVSFATPGREPTRLGQTKGASGTQVSLRRPLTDQQWAIVILCGFTLFAVLVAVVIQKIIAYSKSAS